MSLPPPFTKRRKVLFVSVIMAMVVPLFVIIAYILLTGAVFTPDMFMLYYAVPLGVVSFPLGYYNIWLYYKELKKKARKSPQEFVGNVRAFQVPTLDSAQNRRESPTT